MKLKASPSILLTAAAVAASATAANAAILLNDTFTDGNRTGQSLTSSADWFSRSAASLDNDTGGNVDFDFAGDASNGMLAYFTNSGTQSLAVGESISVSFDLTLTGGGPLDTLANRIRFGLHDSGGSRAASDNTDFNASTFANYTGYWGYVGVSGGGLSSITERDQSNNNLVTTGATTDLGSDADLSDLTIDVTYDLSLTIERTNASTNTITLDVAGIGSISEADNATLRTAFDTVVISFHGPGTTNGIVDNVLVEVVPEPSTYALLTGALAGLLVLRRRR